MGKLSSKPEDDECGPLIPQGKLHEADSTVAGLILVLKIFFDG